MSDDSARYQVLDMCRSNTTSEDGSWDWPGAIPSPEWSTRKHRRMAFRVDETLSDGEGRFQVRLSDLTHVVASCRSIAGNCRLGAGRRLPLFRGFAEYQLSSRNIPLDVQRIN